MFLWRLASQSLATEDVRKHRHMSTNDVFPLCGNNDSWVHSLLECSLSRCVWDEDLSGDNIVEAMMEMKQTSAQLWLFHLQEILSLADFVKMTVTLWAIWTAR